MYETGEYHYQWFDVYRDRLMDEAARERLVRALPMPAWQCALCLRLGIWLEELGRQLEDRARRDLQNAT
jgi:hypothetical protein